MNERIKSLFEDLGRPTLRGIRKCPKCGTFNGTRGMMCKNKSCKTVFKESKEKDKAIIIAVKLHASSGSKIYSVKIQDRNPELWSFVQLPLIEGLNLLQGSPEIELLIQSAAQCHVDSCQQPNENIPELSISLNTCSHVRAALFTTREGKPLPLKNSVLNSLPISTEMKQELWKLSSESSDPLVQRISKRCMVVKCNPDNVHKTGFLHVYFYSRHNKEQGFKYRVICECKPLELSRSKIWKSDNWCIHYYACLCAFASDKQLSKEFRSLLYTANIEKPPQRNSCNSILKRKISILEPAVEIQEIASKVLLIDDSRSSSKKKGNAISKLNENSSLMQENESWSADDTLSRSSEISNKKAASYPIDEDSVKLSFNSWLASVTERINQTMHFQFSGKPDPLVFHVPQMFFDCLQQRISGGSKRKKLPQSTSTFERRNALPLGKFTKYTWHINHLFLVKQIFDTEETPLQVTRSFVENRDGTYDPYEPTKDGENLAEHYEKINNNPLIKPLELKTFLKVGNVSPGLGEEVPFVIEWIPNILPKSAIGELHIKFEFGHMRNSELDLTLPI